MIQGDGAEPDLLNLAMLSKEFLKVFTRSVKWHISHEYCPFTTLLQLEG